MEAKELGNQNTVLLELHVPPALGRGLGTTPRAAFWNGPPTIRLPPGFCFLYLVTHPNQVVPSFRLSFGGGGVSSFQRLWRQLSYWGFSFVFTAPGWLLFPDAPPGAQVNDGHFWSCWRFQSLMFPPPLPQAPLLLTCILILFIYFSTVLWTINPAAPWTAKVLKCGWICIF